MVEQRQHRGVVAVGLRLVHALWCTRW
jgi:hypothetical protein